MSPLSDCANNCLPKPLVLRRLNIFFIFATLNLICNILIITTGGLVRLTKSGLGCPTWPTCSEDSLVPTGEISYHSIIEFGNRTFSIVLALVAIVTLVLSFKVARLCREIKTIGPHPSFIYLSLSLFLLIFLQAFVGGASVLLHLDPGVVGAHFLLSIIAVSIATILFTKIIKVRNCFLGKSAARIPVDVLNPALIRAVKVMFFLTIIVVGLTQIFGVLTTGAGPHSGDPRAKRAPFDLMVVWLLHSLFGYGTLICVVALFFFSFVLYLVYRDRGIKLLAIRSSVLLGMIILQIGFGVYQSLFGLPIWSVSIHMTLAALIASKLTMMVYSSGGIFDKGASIQD